MSPQLFFCSSAYGVARKFVALLHLLLAACYGSPYVLPTRGVDAALGTLLGVHALEQARLVLHLPVQWAMRWVPLGEPAVRIGLCRHPPPQALLVRTFGWSHIWWLPHDGFGQMRLRFDLTVVAFACGLAGAMRAYYLLYEPVARATTRGDDAYARDDWASVSDVYERATLAEAVEYGRWTRGGRNYDWTRIALVIPSLRILSALHSTRQLFFSMLIVIPSFVPVLLIVFSVIWEFTAAGCMLLAGAWTHVDDDAANPLPECNFDSMENALMCLQQLGLLEVRRDEDVAHQDSSPPFHYWP